MQYLQFSKAVNFSLVFITSLSTAEQNSSSFSKVMIRRILSELLQYLDISILQHSIRSILMRFDGDLGHDDDEISKIQPSDLELGLFQAENGYYIFLTSSRMP